MVSNLSDELRIPGVSDVILTDVAVQPVTEVQEAVVHGQQDVRYQTCRADNKCRTDHRKCASVDNRMSVTRPAGQTTSVGQTRESVRL